MEAVPPLPTADDLEARTLRQLRPSLQKRTATPCSPFSPGARGGGGDERPTTVPEGTRHSGVRLDRPQAVAHVRRSRDEPGVGD